MKKVFVEGGNHPIVAMFHNNGWDILPSLEGADLVCFQGGADVSPELYGEKNFASYCSKDVDYDSFVLYINARRKLLPMVGICRGGQFLNVMAGGSMIQDYPGHVIAGTHSITVEENLNSTTDCSTCEVTSTHHQVMVVNDFGSDLIAWAGKDRKQVEIVHHWQEHTLSFQPHPEYVDSDHECQKLFFHMLNKYLGL